MIAQIFEEGAELYMLMNSPVVSTNWLLQNLDNPKLKVVDASWYLSNQKRNGADEYARCHIPGAVFWDIDKISDTNKNLPHTFPKESLFTQHVIKLGLNSEDYIVVYDGMGLYSAARPWWMLRTYGHRNVAILDGGFPKWKLENKPITSAQLKVKQGKFKAVFKPEMITYLDDILANFDNSEFQILDARSINRFLGVEPEPRPKMRSGHIPNSINLPFNKLLNSSDQTFINKNRIHEELLAAGINLEKPVVVTCGSGVTACILVLAFELIGKTEVAVYDGSWSEWGSCPNIPISTGGT